MVGVGEVFWGGGGGKMRRGEGGDVGEGVGG